MSMRFSRWLFLCLLACPMVVACGDSEEDGGSSSSAGKGSVAKASGAGGEADGEVGGAESVAVAARIPMPAGLGPEETIEHVVSQIQAQNPAVIWEVLPASYQSDVNGLVQALGGKMDAEMWDTAWGVIGKLQTLFAEKDAMILKNPTVALLLPTMQMPPQEVSEGLEEAARFLGVLASSDIASIEGLKKCDLGEFFDSFGEWLDSVPSGSGNFLESGLNGAASALGPGVAGVLTQLDRVEVELVSHEGNGAVVKVTDANGESQSLALIEIEGKWLPSDMVTEWGVQMGMAKEALSTLDFAEQKPMVMGMLAMVGGLLDEFNGADTQVKFNGVVLKAAELFNQMTADASTEPATESADPFPDPPADGLSDDG